MAAGQVAMSYVRNGEERVHFWCFRDLDAIQLQLFVVGGKHHRPGDVIRLQLVADDRPIQVDSFHSKRAGQLFLVRAMIPTNSPFFPHLLAAGQFRGNTIGRTLGPAQRVEIDAATEDFRRFFGTCSFLQSS
ncbi:hypothetical protein AVJ23_19495 [Pseudoponticoccus marisrubri]|uniref:Uncharacterized protein n=2 Tax=Pseudoponticoccus marisrubri TaxID=1685382 RepID=A0A0W7WEX4_9RHOB|nr:hypothetical protein AVJ23_19495 [Pseudoponticoccus marisrubri]